MKAEHAISSRYFSNLKLAIDCLNFDKIDEAVKLIEQKWRNGNQVIVIGNGGSSLTALHYVNDWNKSIFLATGRPFYGRTLVDNIGLLMSYANDVSFEDIFVEQLKNILKVNDLVIALSGSGNSENVIRAIEYANLNGAATLGVCGFQGGRLSKVSQHHICSRIDDMQLSEDIHFVFGHIVMLHLCSKAVGNN